MRILCLSTFFALFTTNLFGQLAQQKIEQLADSLILENSNSSFIHHLNHKSYEKINGGFISISKDLKIGTYSEDVTDTICHLLSYRVGYSKIGITRSDGSFSNEPYYSMVLTENKGLYYSLKNLEEYVAYLKGTKRPVPITEENAMKIGFSHLPKNSRHANRQCQLTFHVKDGRIYWLVTRQKGHSTVTEYTAFIDAINGEYVRTEERVIHRGFFRAIGDFFGGGY